MKRTYLLLLPALLISQLAAAQQFRLGAKLGLNYSNVLLPAITDRGTDHIFSYNLGAVGRYSFGSDDFWNVQAELLYSRKGDQSTLQNGRTTRLVNYLDLPVLAKINARGLTFEAGPQAGYLVSAAVDGPFGTDRSRSGLRKFQLGYVAGIGYELSSGYSFTVRYSANVLPMTTQGGFFDGPYLSVFQAQFGYLLGKK
jgi:hypothetical protein